MRKQLEGLQKILRLGQLRIQALRQEIAAITAQIRHLQARLAAIPPEVKSIEEKARKEERERLRELVGKTILPLDLLKLQLIRAQADGQKLTLSNEARHIENQLASLLEIAHQLTLNLARLLKRDHQSSTVCAKLAGRLRFADSLTEERSIAERL